MGASESERRQLTLMFCDMVGSSALSERFDPEDLSDLFSSYQQVCRESITRFGGHVSQYLGDGVLAYFGWPVVQEDDAVRAVRAALAILGSVELVNEGIGKRLGAEIQVRVGLHTGIAVVGDSRSGGLAVGETVNLAARIETFAEHNTIVISGATAQLVAGYFELEAFNPQLLRGFSRPVELFRVLRATAARTKFEAALLGKLTKHVGRNEQLQRLDAIWQEVLSGESRVAVVRGEAGIGKSRLMHEFQQASVGTTAVSVNCFCSPLTQATALAPIVNMLDASVRQRAGETASDGDRLVTLQSMLSEHSRFGPESLPLLAELLSIPGADDSPIQELSAARRRAGVFETMRLWIGSMAERMPLALLIEDVHWADPSTLEFLDLLVRQTRGARMLLSVTARPEFLMRWTQPHVCTLELSRLDASQVSMLVTNVAGGHSLPPLLTKRIVERSEGVPLFVEEVTKAVIESGAVLLDSNHYKLAGTFDEHALPSAGFASIVARFDRLEGSRRIAQLGAAIGREFSYELISALADMSDLELRAHLDRIVASELALVQGSARDAIYQFKHALIQDAIYATLLKRERAQIHERILEVLMERFSQLVSERPEIAAYHAERAGRRELAVKLLRDAGLNALGRTALAESVQHLERAIELVDALHEPERTDLELELQTAIGPAYMTTLGWGAPEVERAITRQRELAIAKADNAKLFQALWSRWTVDFLRGSLDQALKVAREVFEMARASQNPMLEVPGHHAVGYTLFYRGEYQEALEHARDGIALFDLEREREIASIFQFSSMCALYCYQAEAQQVLGLVAEAAKSIARLRELAAELAHPPSQAYALGMQCFFFHAQANAHEVRELAGTLHALSVVEGYALWVAVADIFAAWADAQLGGDANEAAERIRAARAQYDNTRTRVTLPELTCAYAEVLLLAGHPESIRPAVESALEHAVPGRVRHYESELWRLLAAAMNELGEHHQASSFYQTALERALQVGATVLEQRATESIRATVKSFTANDGVLH